MNITRDIAYLGPERKHKLDLYEPAAAAGPRPGIVVIHGGGWRVCDKADKRETQMAETLVAAGYVCASINYTQIQDRQPAWPSYMDDARAAVTWLRARPNVDPQRIGAIGGSAGGNMSLLLGVPADGFEPVRAVVALYPPTDMGWAGKSRVELLGYTPEERPDVVRAASPLFVAGPGFPPTLLIHGTSDATVPVDHSEKMAARLKELGVPHRLIIAEGRPHTFRLQDEANDFRRDVTDFLSQHL